jgi:hypothetical protein
MNYSRRLGRGIGVITLLAIVVISSVTALFHLPFVHPGWVNYSLQWLSGCFIAKAFS